MYEFLGNDVRVLSSQDLWDFYKSYHKRSNRKKVPIYVVAEFFVKMHNNGHFFFDECPFVESSGNHRNFIHLYLDELNYLEKSHI